MTETDLDLIARQVAVDHLQDGVELMSIVEHEEYDNLTPDELRHIHDQANGLLDNLATQLAMSAV